MKTLKKLVRSLLRFFRRRNSLMENPFIGVSRNHGFATPAQAARLAQWRK